MPHIHELKDFTASAFILHPTEPKFLMLKHIKLNKWLQPGGHVELNENPLQTLYHELEEETGLKPTDWDFLDQPEQPIIDHDPKETTLPLPFYLNEHNFNDTHQHNDLTYLVRAKTIELTSKPDGASDIRWLEMDAIRKFYEQKEMFKQTWQVCEWLAKKYFN